MKWPILTIGELSEQVRGVSYAKGDATDSPCDGFSPILRANNIGEFGLNFDKLVYIPDSKIKSKQRILINDVIVAASSGSISVVGKAAQARNVFEGAFGAFCKVLRPGKNVDPRYFGHYFRSHGYRRTVSNLATGANINNLKNEHLDKLQIPLPPLAEQKRIAGILDAADALRARRRESLAQLDTLLHSTFLDMFGDPVLNPMGWEESHKLGEVSKIVSGITKGRKLNGKSTREIPYLAVSNVQDRHLGLDVVKSIQATDDEIKKYRLLKNDLLLTEGGDPDKLGRGSLWNNEIEECIHQNHVFRVRLMDTKLHPVYLSWLIGSMRGKAYFLRSAKQTTGIASINMTQLRAFPLLNPPLDLQRRFAAIVEAVERQKARQRAHLAELDTLFAALQQRAFAGEL